jgi:signal transduction histidine kinase
MPDGGTLTVTSLLAGEPGFIEVSFTDTGPGIPPGFAERIFDPFFTTKEAGHGTGLGLAVCRHLVTGFGGRIEVDDSRKEAGSCFRVMIPIAR